MSQAPDIEQCLNDLRGDQPRRSTRSLTNYSGILAVSIMREAIEDSQHTYDDPGDVEQWYYPDEGLVVIDLGGMADER